MRYQIEYRVISHRTGNAYISRRIIEAETPAKAVIAFNKQVTDHEGVTAVWQEVMTTRSERNTTLRPVN